MTVLLEKYILPILAGLTLLVLATNPMHFSWPQRIASLLGFLLFAGLVSWDIHRRNNKKKKASSTEKDGRIFITVDPLYLAGIFKDHTEIQAEKLAAAYMGKWMKVSGTLRDVSTPDVGLALVTIDHDSGLSFFFRFSAKDWLGHLSVLRRGDHISGQGQIDRIDKNWIRLYNCELAETATK